MITREHEPNIDFGLHVIFDGKKYTMMMPNCLDEYPIGGLISEYTRLAPTELKNLIMECESLNNPGTTDNFVEVFMQLQKKLTNNLPPVIGTMVAVEFMNTSEDWFNAVRTDRVEEYKRHINTDTYESIKEFIFEDTGYSEIGGESVLQLLLTCYFSFASTYVITKHMFTQIMESDEIEDETHDRSIELLSAMYSNFIDAQHIDYRIINTNNGLESLYTIKTSISLLLFEMAHSINTETKIVKCKNCGHYFVPEGRSDSLYCSFPLHDNKEKTCKDVGAQITRANKEKTDAATKEYRKVYMRYKMMTNRHPEDSDAAAKLKHLTTEAKTWRNKLANGLVTTVEFLEWLNKF